MLFQWELGEHTPQHVIATFLRSQRTDPEEESFARSLFEGTVSEVESLNRMIQERAEHWRLERMAAVDPQRDPPGALRVAALRGNSTRSRH